MESILDKFSTITLKVLTYVFLLSAVACAIMWINEVDSYSSKETPWVIWASAILTSLFFAATSHTVGRVMERIHNEEYESDEEYSSTTPVYDSEGNQNNL